MAHEKSMIDVICTREDTPAAWHKLDTRISRKLCNPRDAKAWADLWDLAGLGASEKLRLVSLADLLKDTVLAGYRLAEDFKLLVDESIPQVNACVTDWKPVPLEEWRSHVEAIRDHLEQTLGVECLVSSVGTVDQKRKLFVSIEVPSLSFGIGKFNAGLYFSFLGSHRDGYATKALCDATRVVCANTYAVCDRSGSPLQWSLGHRSEWNKDAATSHVKAMITAAQAGIALRAEQDSQLAGCEMSPEQQRALLALVMAATEQHNVAKPIMDAIAPVIAPIATLEEILAETMSERKTIAAVDLLAGKTDGIPSRIFQTLTVGLRNQPGNWGNNAQAVESVITWAQTQRGQSGNLTARANGHFWQGARADSAKALGLCMKYVGQRAASDVTVSACAPVSLDAVLEASVAA